VSAEDPLPRTFWFLFAGALVNRIGSFVIPLFSIFLTGERALPPTTAGWVIAMYGLGSLMSGPTGGTLADRYGRRPTMLLGFCWGAVAMLLVPHAQTPRMLALASFHLGLAGDLYRPAVQAAVADLCPPAQRARAYGLLYWAVNLGFAVAAALGGMLAHLGFSRLFMVDAATTLCFAIVIALFVPETRPKVAAPSASATQMGGYGEALRDGVLLRFLLTQCLVGVLFLQAYGPLPVALAQRGIGAKGYGLIIAENGLIIVALQPVALAIVARLRRTHALALGAIFVGVGFGINALPLGIAGAAASVFVWTLGEIVSTPIVGALPSDLAPLHLRGRYQGMSQMSYGLCALIGPPAGMWMLEHASARGLWLACAGLGLLAAMLFLRSAPALRMRLGSVGRPA